MRPLIWIDRLESGEMLARWQGVEGLPDGQQAFQLGDPEYDRLLALIRAGAAQLIG